MCILAYPQAACLVFDVSLPQSVLALFEPHHCRTCVGLLQILLGDLSAGCSSAMNEQNFSEVSVYGGPRSLEGENQS